MSMGPYRGIVTDNNDPDLACRVKATIPELYYDPYEGTCMESPWLEAAGAATSGQGSVWVPPVGSAIWVWVEDSSEEGVAWSLMYLCGPAARTKAESGVPAVARGVDDESAAAFKGGVVDATTGVNVPRYLIPNPGTGIAFTEDTGGFPGEVSEPTAFQAELSMPNTFNEGVYPHNRVIKTPGGIVLEVDDTPDNERVHIWHPSGSYWELNARGAMVERSAKKFQETEGLSEIIKGSRKTYIGVDHLLTVDGSSIEKTRGRRMVLASQIGVQASARLLVHSQGDMTLRSQGTCLQQFVCGRKLEVGGMDSISKEAEKAVVLDRSEKTYGANVHLNFQGIPNLAGIMTYPVFSLAGSVADLDVGACATINLQSAYAGMDYPLIKHVKINMPTVGTTPGFVLETNSHVSCTTTDSVAVPSKLVPWNTAGVSGTGVELCLGELSEFVLDVQTVLVALDVFAKGASTGPIAALGAALALVTDRFAGAPAHLILSAELEAVKLQGGTAALRSQ